MSRIEKLQATQTKNRYAYDSDKENDDHGCVNEIDITDLKKPSFRYYKYLNETNQQERPKQERPKLERSKQDIPDQHLHKKEEMDPELYSCLSRLWKETVDERKQAKAIEHQKKLDSIDCPVVRGLPSHAGKF